MGNNDSKPTTTPKVSTPKVAPKEYCISYNIPEEIKREATGDNYYEISEFNRDIINFTDKGPNSEKYRRYYLELHSKYLLNTKKSKENRRIIINAHRLSHYKVIIDEENQISRIEIYSTPSNNHITIKGEKHAEIREYIIKYIKATKKALERGKEIFMIL